MDEESLALSHPEQEAGEDALAPILFSFRMLTFQFIMEILGRVFL